MSFDPVQIVEVFRVRTMARVKGLLQQAGYRFAVYVERFIDDKGPPAGTPSSSSHIGAQSGGISRALIPRQQGNITNIVIDHGGARLETGIDENLLPYARIQEVGGTITAKRAGALTIPITPEAAVALKAAGGNIRSLGLQIIQGKNGNAILVKVDGETITPWFALKKSVTLRARPYYEPGTKAFYEEEIPRMNEELLQGLAEDWEAL